MIPFRGATPAVPVAAAAGARWSSGPKPGAPASRPAPWRTLLSARTLTHAQPPFVQLSKGRNEAQRSGEGPEGGQICSLGVRCVNGQRLRAQRAPRTRFFSLQLPLLEPAVSDARVSATGRTQACDGVDALALVAEVP